MKKLSLIAAALVLAAAALPAIADGTGDQVRSRRVNLLERVDPTPTAPVVAAETPLAGRQDARRIEPELNSGLEDSTPLAFFDASAASVLSADVELAPASLEDLDVHALSARVELPTQQSEVQVMIRRALANLHCLSVPFSPER